MTARAVAQMRWELRLLFRNGEQLLLTFVIPIALLVGLSVTDLLPGYYATDRPARALATVLAVSVISAAFTSLAIATGFERRSGSLRFLGTTPLTRLELMVGKSVATLAVTVLSSAAVLIAAIVLGWRAGTGSLWALPALFLGTAAFATCGFALAGLFRAEAVLAIANGLFLALILFGGVIVPASSLPGPVAALVPWLPSGALANALTQTLVNGTAPSLSSVLVLAGWLIAGAAVSARTFRWS